MKKLITGLVLSSLSLGASAATVSNGDIFSFGYPSGNPDSNILYLPVTTFDSSLGQLNSATISVDATVEASMIFHDVVPGGISTSLSFTIGGLSAGLNDYGQISYIYENYNDPPYGDWDFQETLQYNLSDSKSRVTDEYDFLDYNFVGDGIIQRKIKVSTYNAVIGLDFPDQVSTPIGDNYFDWDISYSVIYDYTPTNPSPVPVPGAVWLLGSGLIGLIGMARRKKA